MVDISKESAIQKHLGTGALFSLIAFRSAAGLSLTQTTLLTSDLKDKYMEDCCYISLKHPDFGWIAVRAGGIFKVNIVKSHRRTVISDSS